MQYNGFSQSQVKYLFPNNKYGFPYLHVFMRKGWFLPYTLINYPNSNSYVPDKVLSIRQALRIEAKKSRVIINPGRPSIQVK